MFDAEENTSRGAGGTSGGIGTFFTGLAMMICGGYIFTNMVQVRSSYFRRFSLFDSGIDVTPLASPHPIRFNFWLFMNGKSKLDGCSLGSCLAIFVGIIMSLEVHLYRTNLYQLD